MIILTNLESASENKLTIKNPREISHDHNIQNDNFLAPPPFSPTSFKGEIEAHRTNSTTISSLDIAITFISRTVSE